MATVPLFFQLSVTLICMTESLGKACHPVINQPEEVTVLTTVQAITLPCSVTYLCRISAKSPIHWFVFSHDSHREIRVQHPKYFTDNRGLTIQSPQTNDSGVYYCSLRASSSNVAPSIGPGTRLVVRERRDITQTALLWTLLWTLFTVLALYSLLILVLLICKKTRQEIFRSARRNTTRKRVSARRLHFRAVVQELYRKRNLQSTAQNTTHTTSPHSNFEHPHAYSPDEGDYVNSSCNRQQST